MKKILKIAILTIVMPIFCLAEDSPVSLYKNAKDAYKRRDYANAVADLDKAIAETKDAPNHNFYYWRARSKFGMNDYVGAVKDFDKVVELKNDSADVHVYYWRARAQISQKDYTRAVKDLDKALALAKNSEDFHFYFWRGVAKFELGDHKGTLADMQKAEALYPKSANAFYYQMRSAEALKDYKTAEEAALRCLKLKLDKKTEKVVRESLRDLYKNKLDRPADAATQDAAIGNL